MTLRRWAYLLELLLLARRDVHLGAVLHVRGGEHGADALGVPAVVLDEGPNGEAREVGRGEMPCGVA